ncbi:MAG: LAGLIDADG family homing endonuclease [Candidatus Tenebribacter davisii]|nr:LAGLIDADG family homing endonuclease [Candidatus Tenebribacter davisii]
MSKLKKISRIKKIKKDFKDSLKKKVIKSKEVDPEKLVPTGSITFNLECSGRIEGAFKFGKLINLIGDSHAGKCVRDSYILTENGMEYIDSIGKSFDFGTSMYKQKLATSKGISDTTSHFWKEEVAKTIKIKTNKGYSIEGTKDHPIMIFNNNFQFEMKKLKDIKQGDCAIIARSTNCFPLNLFKLPKIIVKGTNVKQANIPEHVDENFARLLGYIVADGNISKNQVHISNTKKYIRKDLEVISDNLGLHLNLNGISSKHLQMIISKIFNLDNFTARYKYVPDCILQSPKSIQAAFLRALFDCDSGGSDKEITYFSTSKQLANQVHLMLLNFGIISTLSFKDGAFDGVKFHDHKYWAVAFYGNELNIYREQIGSLKYNIPVKSEYRNSDYDSVPNLANKMKEDINKLRRKLGWAKNGRCRYYDGIFPRFKFANVKNGSKRLINEFIKTFSELPIDLSLYRQIQNSGYCFDAIKEVKHIEKETVVYDVHIPNTHLFWSNGFVSHNTLFALTVFAECTLEKRFNNFRFIFDDVEAADEFDIAYLFGEMVFDRIEKDIRSKTIEDLNDNLARALKEDEPFIYVLDSFDGLTSEAAMKKDSENRKKREKDNETTGSFGDGKAKKASEMFSQRTQDLNDHGSLLIVISQTRDNIGFGAKFTPKVRSGGKALKFYAAHEIWLACQKREKKGKRTVITNVQAKITKNKLTGRHGEAYFPILFDYGVDNLTSCIIFIVEEGVWTGTAKAINTKGFLTVLAPKKKKSDEDKWINPSMKQLIADIEDNNREEELFALCQETYDNVIGKLKPQRKRKY